MDDWDPTGGNLIFIFCPPRSGSTMLQLMLESHSQIRSLPEPFLLIPLKNAGYFDHPRHARYDVLNSSLALREFVGRLPGGERDYIEACRAYANTLYTRARGRGCRYFLDKTPPNVLEWEFITRIYPRARYVVLVRHPLAVLHSMCEMSFLGDYERIRRENPLLPQYVPAIASFRRQAAVRPHVVRYEELVRDPEPQARALLEFLDLEFEPAVVEYGRQPHLKGSLGDPIAAHRQQRPAASPAERWARILSADCRKLRVAREIAGRLDPEDLRDYGYPRPTLLEALDLAPGSAPGRGRLGPRLSGYRLKRRIFFALRWLARRRPLRGLLESLRYHCDVLLTR